MQRGKKATVSQVPAINPHLPHTERSETVKLWPKIQVQKLNLAEVSTAEVSIDLALVPRLPQSCVRMKEGPPAGL